MISFSMSTFYIINLPLFLLIYTLLFVFSFSIGLLIMVLNYKLEFFREVFSIAVMRPLWLTSGIFFTADILPSNLINFIIYNPLFQFIELTRFSTSYNNNLFSRYGSIEYITGVTLISLLISILVYSNSERSLIRK